MVLSKTQLGAERHVPGGQVRVLTWLRLSIGEEIWEQTSQDAAVLGFGKSS
jgi:hypothetical protein